jgi:hypothetical protein
MMMISENTTIAYYRACVEVPLALACRMTAITVIIPRASAIDIRRNA